MKRGVKYLWSIQHREGRWEANARRGNSDTRDYGAGTGNDFGGLTAIAVYALLSSGEKPNDPRMQRAIAFLRNAETTGTYGLGLRCEVWHLLPTDENHKLLQQDAVKLAGGLAHEGRGMWDYTSYVPGKSTTWDGSRVDHSNSQYGVLGLWTAAEGGILVADADWKLIDQKWRDHQNRDGGWSYDGVRLDRGSTISMTAAGVATLLITQDLIPPPTGGWCRGNIIDPQVESGIRFIGANWQDIGRVYGAYTWYGIQRIGAAGGYKYIASNNWYNAGVADLLSKQNEDGAWQMDTTPLADTAFALLFMSHGRAPILMNKLNYAAPYIPPTPAPKPAPVDSDAESPVAADQPAEPAIAAAPESQPALPAPIAAAHWNQRPRDVANLTRFVARNTERMLNWQMVDLSTPLPELHDAPILFLSGNEAISFGVEDEAKLRLFVQQGGMLLANADCPGKNGADDLFSASIKQLGAKLFGGTFRPLQASHCLLAEQQYRHWDQTPNVLGLTNGVRELMVLLASDPGVTWQRNDRADPTGLQLGADVCLYATDKQDLRYKGQNHIVTLPKAAPSFKIRIARLKAGVNWNPEPAGWTRLDAVLRRSLSVGLAPEVVAPDPGKLTGFTVAHLTGTTAFSFTPAQRQELARFVAAGGTLVVDAAGGASPFADAAEKELATIFNGDPSDLGKVLPPDHALYKLPSAEITAVDYRNYARRHTHGKLNAPRIRGIERGDRVAVFYSREDLTGGLVGEDVDGILGYSPESATEIMRNIVLYAAAHAPGNAK